VVKRAVRQHGTKLIVIDPREITLTRYADIWLRQRPGTDVAVLNGLMNVILAENLYDKAYVEGRTENFEAFRKVVEKYTPEEVEKISGVPAEDLKRAARMYAKAKRASILYSMGITQHITGTDNVKSIANLSMLCGNVGVEGGGVNPLRGQNNVQGACDMGALPNVLPAYQQVASPEVRAFFEKAWGVKALPDKPGLTVVEIMNAAHHGDIRGLYIMGENPMVSDPDLSHVEDSLKKLDFLVVQDIFLTETARLADVVLPSASFAEKDGTFTNTERRVQRIRKAVSSPGEALPDWAIIAGIATRMGYPMAYGNVREIWEEIRKVTPSCAGISYKRIEREGIQWPCPNVEHPGTRFLHKDRFTRGRRHRVPAAGGAAGQGVSNDPVHGTGSLPLSHGDHDPPGEGPLGAVSREPRRDPSRGCVAPWHRRRARGSAHLAPGSRGGKGQGHGPLTRGYGFHELPFPRGRGESPHEPGA
jgi:predicted molibdopterin-dependent oxidoreductase YjgC